MHIAGAGIQVLGEKKGHQAGHPDSPMPDCALPTAHWAPEAVYFLAGMGISSLSPSLSLSPPLASEAAKSNQPLHPHQAGIVASS